MHKPAVITFPESVVRLKKGFDQIADLTACTYGPTRGVVLYQDALKSQPEVLTDAATMVRRVTSLGESSMDVGAMIMRNLIWRGWGWRRDERHPGAGDLRSSGEGLHGWRARGGGATGPAHWR